jgi:hypothetical protein
MPGTHHRVFAQGGNGQIGTSGFQGFPGTGQYLVGQFDVGLGLAGEGIQHRKQPLAGHDGVHGQGDAGFPAPLQGPGILHQLGGGMQQLAAALQQQPAYRGELGFMAGSIEQRQIQLVFQLLDGVTERGGNLAQLVGGGGKAAPALDGIQHPQGLQGQGFFSRHNSLSGN